MAIDRLSSTSALIAAMRESMARRTGQGTRAAEVGSPPAPLTPKNARPDVAALRTQLVELVRDVDVDDPEVVRRLRPRFVRAVLLWEFGAELREYADWQPMLETLVATLEADEVQQRNFHKLLIDLKKNSSES